MKATLNPTYNPNRREGRAFLQRMLGRFGTFFQMLRDPEYRLPGKLVFLMVFSVIYILSPLDFIPDIFFPLGFADDLALFGATIHFLNAEIDRYLKREIRQ